MKHLSFITIVVVLSLFGSTAILNANATRGQKLFKKNFRKACGFSGTKFAKKHTQEEWKKIYTSGDLKNEAKKICPRLKLEKIKESWWKDIYDFSYEYALGSAQIPSC